MRNSIYFAIFGAALGILNREPSLFLNIYMCKFLAVNIGMLYSSARYIDAAASIRANYLDCGGNKLTSRVAYFVRGSGKRPRIPTSLWQNMKALKAAMDPPNENGKVVKAVMTSPLSP